MKLTIDEHHQHKDVYAHSLTVLQQAIDLETGDPDPVLRWAALLHDIGKPATRRHEDGAASASTTTRSSGRRWCANGCAR